ncbi:MAG: SDR family NAD(P)-dependent oxidoreductase [Candidatus Dadabacteria bacterium]|nr:MAG: SDR family NAD(P)-dependent oxidoreductase [Candidatus Dadabacteria bacterium]
MLLEGKVAIVTGAARGLGRAEALELARHGARLVINDLGTNADGTGRDEEPARAVVEEIKAMGGEAVPHFGDVADWNDSRSMIQTAIDTFGDLHILVNNAGFCRDRMIFNMSEEEFDSVIRVHLKGHFCSMRFASEYWRNQSKAKGGPVYARIINTSSEAFIFGSPGQPNYAAAKAGIVAMTMAAAQSLQKYGVLANAIMPRARTRMNDTPQLAAMFAKPESGFDTYAPENCAPLVAYLASPKAERVSGYVLIVYGKQVTIVERPRVDTKFENEDAWTVEALDAKLGPYFAERQPVIDGFVVPPM